MLKSRIISDSTCRRIRNRDIEQRIDLKQEKGVINNHPNAEADEIHHYALYHLEKDRPDNLVIVAGLNDLLHTKNRQDADCDAIAQKVINIGRTAREKGYAYQV